MSFIRSVMMDGLIYREHEVTTVTHSIENDLTTVEVRSTQTDDGNPTRHWYSKELALGMVDAEGWVQGLPEFEEYDDPAGEAMREAEAERDAALSHLDETLRILTDEQAGQVIDAFPEWEAGVAYKVGERVKYDGKLYRCVQAHTSQADWHPDIVPPLWTPLQAEGGDDDPTTIPVWVQPTGAQDAYNKGDRVWYPDASGQVWESTMDGNVWSPEAYPAGWKLIEQE